MVILREGRHILCSVVIYILEGWLMLHLLMISSFIGRVVYTGLSSVVLREGWPRLACVQYYCRTAGSGWLVCSVELQDSWPSLTCVQ